MRGQFITFEGGEGSGKSTQCNDAGRASQALGIKLCIVTREPGGSPGAEIIRHVLLSGVGKPLGPEAETMLFAAARDDHVVTTIEPALERGTWVICDRFADSTRVYQGALGQVDAALLRRGAGHHRRPQARNSPSFSIVPAEDGLAARRRQRRGTGDADRFEAEDLEFHQELRDAYRQMRLRNRSAAC